MFLRVHLVCVCGCLLDAFLFADELLLLIGGLCDSLLACMCLSAYGCSSRCFHV